MLARTLGPGKLLGIDACWSETNGVQEFHMQGEHNVLLLFRIKRTRLRRTWDLSEMAMRRQLTAKLEVLCMATWCSKRIRPA